MYKLHLILKYLRRRRIAWVSLIAVMLCTTMVIVVISVMGGWLRMFRESFHNISGDVLVQGRSLLGFPHYQQMIKQIEALPEVQTAAPVIRTWGFVNVNNQIRQGVSVIGYPANIGQVNGFTKSLFRMEDAKELSFKLPLPADEYRPPPGFDPRGKDPKTWDGMIAGDALIGFNKDAHGKIDRPLDVLYHAFAVLTVVPISAEKAAPELTDKTMRFYWLVDDSRTNVSFQDANTVYVPFEALQRDLQMDGQGGEPARTTDIQIALKPGASLGQAREKIAQIVDQVTDQFGRDFHYPYTVMTWQETHARFLGQVEKEKVLMTFLFGIISVVAIFLIFCIFYMIVVEKTRDIGIVKSVGATSSGVAGIFLGYGASIGIVGAGLGLLASFLIVHNINWLHAKLGELMGIQLWSADTYLFDTIPSTMNPREVSVILVVAIFSSIVGALVPAIRAARMHPVEALRWE